MTAPSRWLDEGLIVDNFAGGGGASTGIEMALGRSPDVAINHDAEAVALHAANHPDTLHLCQNVWKADPREVVRQASARRCAMLGIPVRDLPVRFAWFSPDCKHFSKAKGSKPVEKGIRDLAWVVVHWARLVSPEIIALENEHGQPVDEPLHTTTAKPRFALVTVNGWPIVDIGLRMLQPRELYRAQGFPPGYVIDGAAPNGKPMTKTAQVRMCGNSVCPPIAQAIARAVVFGREVAPLAGAAD